LSDELRRTVSEAEHVLLSGRKRVEGAPLSIVLMVAASDRGLCGGFNNKILKMTAEFLRQHEGDFIRLVTVGHRVERAMRKTGREIIASFPALSNAPSALRASPISRLLVDEFLSGRADRVFIIFTDFKSAMTQIPMTEQLLPTIPEEELKGEEKMEEKEEPRLLFEPSPDKVLDALLPRMVDAQLYQALLESSASEHSARMMAMRSAGDAASDMLESLTFTLNQARQALLT
jgi:F-type H+-transporting ATPase subunit gamma